LKFSKFVLYSKEFGLALTTHICIRMFMESKEFIFPQ